MALASERRVARLDDPEEPWRGLYRVGGAAALIQLAAILAYTVAVAALGPRPAGAAAFFAAQQGGRLAAMLRGDLLLLPMLGAYLGTFPAILLAMRRTSPVAAALATLFTCIAVTVCFATESTFALIHLGDQYAAASSAAQREQLVAAGEAVIAADMWNSSGAYMSGILLQGGGVIVSLAMLRSPAFGRATAIAGLLGNALDLAQHLLHPFAPAVSTPIQMAMGPFYLVWFVLLSRDLFRLGGRGGAP